MDTKKRIREPKVYQGRYFHDIKLNKKREYYEPYLTKSKELLDYVTGEHNRVLSFSLIFRFPEGFKQDRDVSYISRFIRIFQRKVDVTLEERRKRKVRVHHIKTGNKVFNIWCRERDSSNNDHYHMFILVSYENFRTLGHYSTSLEPKKSLAILVQEAWSDALGISYSDMKGFVQFPPKNNYFRVVQNRPDTKSNYDNLLSRIYYLAKRETKNFGEGIRSFGCSRIKKG
ncbi:YagK/YfjJ domain-containing protein [Vibrio kanaloae]|uniref:Inovirus Gp2 family protein n=1 Tax=Vibrio kanaloae TaxID=170673 RepID=A0A4U1YKJ5_9VIBR|nr:inovirus-type Gp2 protein [Vibrio kanaloae]TKF21454.1 inovirus Gp2 family protein [Vibrio kanaloae]